MNGLAAAASTIVPFPEFHNHIQIGYVVGLVIAGVLVGAGAIGIVLGMVAGIGKTRRRDNIIIAIGAAVAVVGALVGFLDWFPGGSDYNGWNVEQGTVLSIHGRLLAGDTSGSGSTENFPVQMKHPDGTVGTYRCDDSRCANVEPGDVIALQCHKEYSFSIPRSAQGWVCDFLASRGRTA